MAQNTFFFNIGILQLKNKKLNSKGMHNAVIQDAIQILHSIASYFKLILNGGDTFETTMHNRHHCEYH